MILIINSEDRRDKEKLYNHLKTLFSKKGFYEVSFKRHLQKRTEKQNAYWHSVICTTIANVTGSDPSTVHTYLKHKFLGIRRTFEGEEFIESRSTSDLNVEEMSKLIEEVILWAKTNFNIDIPTANEIPNSLSPYQDPKIEIGEKPKNKEDDPPFDIR